MNLTHHHVYYVFDVDDVHYTNTLLRLRSEAYLWHELRSLGKADFCVSLSVNNNQLQLRTFDSSSRELLALQKGLLGKWNTKSIRNNLKKTVAESQSLPFQKLSQSKSFWSWLGEAARKLSDCTISVLITYDAVNKLACAEYLQKLPPNCIVMIRLPGEAEALESIAHGADKPVFPAGMCTEKVFGEQTPLMEALKRELGDQMICLFPQQEDIANLLLYTSLREENHNSPEQLMDQAEYLYLLWSRRRMQFLNQTRYSEESVEQVRLSTIATDLKECWPTLQKQVEKLRQVYGTGTSMENLLYSECLIPTEESGMGLYKADPGNQLLQIRKLITRSQAPDRLKSRDFGRLMRLATVWNKRRNKAVDLAVQQCCQKAFMAIGQELWDGLEVVLDLLQFCADFVCAEPEKVPDIPRVLELGNEIFDRQQMLRQFDWTRKAFAGGENSACGQYSSVIEYTHAVTNMLTQQQYEQVNAETQTKLILLRQLIQKCYGITGSAAQMENILDQIQGAAHADSSTRSRMGTERDRRTVDRLLYENGIGAAYSSCDDDDDEVCEDAE